jgi:hypothetical protein
MRMHFFDNTDPQGIDRVLSSLQHRLDHTLCVVISKSGGTPETRNGMLEAEAAFKKAGIDFGSHAVAVTGVGSQLDKYAEKGRLACSIPDVGLGRGPDVCDERRWSCAPDASRYRHARLALGSGSDGRMDAHLRDAENPAMLSH